MKFKKRHSGMTLVELMITIALAAILITLALPGFTQAFARSQVRGATENVVQAIRLAKNTARAASTNVTVTFTTDSGNNAITFTFPDGSNKLLDSITLEPVELPANVSVAGDTTDFTFNSMGMTNATGALVITSIIDANFTRTVTIVNSLGNVSIT